jgi:hypothetical protein
LAGHGRGARIQTLVDAAAVVYALAIANAGVIVWLWIHGGNLHPTSTGELLTSIGRITGRLLRRPRRSR